MTNFPQRSCPQLKTPELWRQGAEKCICSSMCIKIVEGIGPYILLIAPEYDCKQILLVLYVFSCQNISPASSEEGIIDQALCQEWMV